MEAAARANSILIRVAWQITHIDIVETGFLSCFISLVHCVNRCGRQVFKFVLGMKT
jgi:hypothetical protein